MYPRGTVLPWPIPDDGPAAPAELVEQREEHPAPHARVFVCSVPKRQRPVQLSRKGIFDRRAVGGQHLSTKRLQARPLGAVRSFVEVAPLEPLTEAGDSRVDGCQSVGLCPPALRRSVAAS